jgi:ABC-type glycerol-3-phosphate transport system substrate-binding protein
MIPSACSTVAPPAGRAEPSRQKTELRLWHGWRTERQRILESVVDEFECRNAEVAIAIESFGPSAGFVAERMLLDSTRRPPELALVDRDSIPLLAEAGLIRPLDEIFEAGSESDILLKKRKLLDSARAFATFDGRLYGIPAYLNPYVMIYDPEALHADTGTARPPASWNDLIDVAAKLEKMPAVKDRWVLSVRSMAPLFQILCAQKGITLFEYESDSHSGEVIREELDFIRSLRREHALLPPQHKHWAPQFSGVANGRALFQIDTAMTFARISGGSERTLAAAEVPADSRTSRTTLAHSPIFVASTAADGSAVLKFLEFFYSPERYARFVNELAVVSPWKGAASPGQTSISDIRSYARIVSAAERALVQPLHARNGTAMPRIARIVERLDAGLLSSRKATKEILEVTTEADGLAETLQSSPVIVSWADSTERLFAGDRAGSRLPPVWISAVRNEHESFQLALSTAVEMNDLTLSCAPFVSADNGLPDIKIDAALIDDTNVSIPLVAAKPGLYPNVLRPIDGFSASPGELTRIWVSVFVPAGIPPGDYPSRITIMRADTVAAEVPITVRVFPLEIPAAPSLPAFAGLNYNLIAQYYGVAAGSREYRELMDAFYWYLVERRLTPLQPPVSLDSPNLASYMNDPRLSGYRLPFNPAEKRFAEAVAAAEQGGWLDKTFSYFIDEPTYHQYKDILDAAELIHSMPASPKFLVACFPDDPLIGAVDIWCIHLRFLPEGIPHGHMERADYVDAVARRLEAGDDIWWYTAGAVAPVPTLHVEDDPSAFRIIPWMQRLYQITGFLHWEAANWQGSLNDPFVNFFGNGEGVLVYPGKSGPISSIRLELLREGLEDLEYLTLLQKGIEQVRRKLATEEYEDAASQRVGEICRRLIQDAALRTSGSGDLLLLAHFLREPGLIERVREEVIDETIALHRRPHAIVLTKPEEKQYTGFDEARIYGMTEPGCHVEINGRDVTVSESGDFSARFPLRSGTNRFEILLQNEGSAKLIHRKIEKE